MATKKKKKPARKPKPCVVCREHPADAGYSGICSECDDSYAVALANKVGTIEWAATRARDMQYERVLEAVVTAGDK